MDLFDHKNVAPMLIAKEKPAFDNSDWIYELKWDGIRCITYLDKNGTILRNKRNKDITAIYPELGQIHKQTQKPCILDGELFVFKDGGADFSEVLRRSLMTDRFKIELAAAKLPVSFVTFDILYLGREQITDKPLIERKAILENNIKESDRLAISRYIEERGIDLYKAAEAQQLEGIVAKRKDSHYYLGKHTRDWVKCKALLNDDFVVCGYYFNADNLISVVLGQFSGKELVYQGHVVIGVSRADFKRISAVKEVPKADYYLSFPDFDVARWLEPSLVCIVEFMERTKHGGLRQPVFKGLRDDKAPGECVTKKI